MWDNRPETFDENLLEVDIFVRGWNHWKKPQAIAKIFGELFGDSKKLMKALSETDGTSVPKWRSSGVCRVRRVGRACELKRLRVQTW